MSAPTDRNFGEQPLHRWMQAQGVRNRDLVELSQDQLTFRQLSRARRGRWLTIAMRAKILSVVNAWIQIHSPDQPDLKVRDLFNYCRDADP